jgi:hypothetical protein
MFNILLPSEMVMEEQKRARKIETGKPVQWSGQNERYFQNR